MDSGRLSSLPQTCDVLVVGGGHAGVEAAWAAAHALGPSGSVVLLTMDPSRIGVMSCNPAIGGLAKGQVVREVDALGGLMGAAADASGIMFKVLNQSRGPAVQGPRAQCDKDRYASAVQSLLGTRSNITVAAGTVGEFIIDAGVCGGVHTEDGRSCRAAAVVLTTGTFMRSLMHTGSQTTAGGRVGEGTADGVSACLQRLGFSLGRLKTGTPPRLAKASLDWDALPVQTGDAHPVPFSDLTGGEFPPLPQVTCRLTHTTAESHALIRDNLHQAPMFSGQIDAAAGPRYCPSIEDKVVRFADRAQHHVFLEPETLDGASIYCNGISTSLPPDVQDVVVRSMPGCERAEILQYGYAVEYDMIRPHQLDVTCETKRVAGLFTAGQINGTSGYEEAAGQGWVAGVNAARRAMSAPPLRLGRDQAYIGVMLDDLVTRAPTEPYRLFTSRAEHRMLLRADNADERLTPVGRAAGTVCDSRWDVWVQRRHRLDDIRRRLDAAPGDGGKRLTAVARRPDVTPEAIAARLGGGDGVRDVERVMTDTRYDGYVKRQQAEIKRQREADGVAIPVDLDPTGITGLRTEAAEAIAHFRPATLGQASRLAGVTPADATVLAVAIRRQRAGGTGR
ncbi:MAG: tRNA uridine-5-carboxymethylaminomethyl(34) synthesis enzyme MnmG [Phycisphaerales bacterium]|jgi:tRNA uridine 5-carboxymethylaminomethyl modification enzyme|nr:tRNA uridine-5-carboxymethylaminomethyl(34) synthesis enzyme MnmG [Phycisphaerales bacterium]